MAVILLQLAAALGTGVGLERARSSRRHAKRRARRDRSRDARRRRPCCALAGLVALVARARCAALRLVRDRATHRRAACAASWRTLAFPRLRIATSRASRVLGLLALGDRCGCAAAAGSRRRSAWLALLVLLLIELWPVSGQRDEAR